MGRTICRRAVRLGWDVNAYSMYQGRQWKLNWRDRIMYSDKRNWEENLTWNYDIDYDECFEKFHDAICNSTGLIYCYEPTPYLDKVSFQDNAVRISKIIGINMHVYVYSGFHIKII